MKRPVSTAARNVAPSMLLVRTSASCAWVGTQRRGKPPRHVWLFNGSASLCTISRSAAISRPRRFSVGSLTPSLELDPLAELQHAELRSLGSAELRMRLAKCFRDHQTALTDGRWSEAESLADMTGKLTAALREAGELEVKAGSNFNPDS